MAGGVRSAARRRFVPLLAAFGMALLAAAGPGALFLLLPVEWAS